MKNRSGITCSKCKEPLDVTDTTFDIQQIDVNQNLYILLGELKVKSKLDLIKCDFCKDK